MGYTHLICRSINLEPKKKNANVLIKTDNDDENIFACPIATEIETPAKEEAEVIVEKMPEIAIREENNEPVEPENNEPSDPNENEGDNGSNDPGEEIPYGQPDKKSKKGRKSKK